MNKGLLNEIEQKLWCGKASGKINDLFSMDDIKQFNEKIEDISNMTDTEKDFFENYMREKLNIKKDCLFELGISKNKQINEDNK